MYWSLFLKVQAINFVAKNISIDVNFIFAFSLFIWKVYGLKLLCPSFEKVVYDENLDLMHGIFHDF